MRNAAWVPMTTAEVLAPSIEATPAARMKIAPISDAPVTRPRLRDRLSRPDTTPRCGASVPATTKVLFAAWKVAKPAVRVTSGTI